MSKRWVFFDLDATLIDVQKAQHAAIEEFYIIYDFCSKTDLVPFIKKWDELANYHYAFYTRKEISFEEQRDRMIIDLFKTYGITLTKTPRETYVDYLELYEKNWETFDDVRETLVKLQQSGHKLGIISNGDFVHQTQKLRKTGIINSFDIVTTSSEYMIAKPDPRVFEAIIKRFNLNKEEMIMIGDQVAKDVLPCLSLGIEAVWINRNNLANIHGVKEIKSLNELFTNPNIYNLL